jgi:hypothetical protein
MLVIAAPTSNKLLIEADDAARHAFKEKQAPTFKILGIRSVRKRWSLVALSGINPNSVIVSNLIGDVANTAPAIVKRQALQRPKLCPGKTRILAIDIPQ